VADPKFIAALKQMTAAKRAASTALAIVQAQATDIAADEAAEDIVGAEEETEELIAGDDLEAAGSRSAEIASRQRFARSQRGVAQAKMENARSASSVCA
jgi:hypothetical protein